MTPLDRTVLAGAVQTSWRTFLDTLEPMRPDLYRYCRYLTRSPWDAEDMVQEALSRAFVSLGMLAEPPRNPRAWLFRIASNQWLNRRRQQREPLAEHDAQALGAVATNAATRETREAAGTLLAQLAPRERAAVVLKDAFGLSLEEVAEALSTTTGAVKAALHRGRGKLLEPEPEAATVAPPVLDAFCAAFNARDLDRLTALLLDTATLEYPGFKLEEGAAAVRSGSLQGTLFGCSDQPRARDIPTPRCELRVHRGEPLLLWWSGDAVHAVVRTEIAEERIARLLNYYHAPEVLTEVCRELGVPCATHGRFPTLAAVGKES